MAKKQEASSWKKVKKIFGFESNTKTITSSTTTTISLSREEADAMKQKVFDLTRHASNGAITKSLNEALSFAEECDHEFHTSSGVGIVGSDS